MNWSPILLVTAARERFLTWLQAQGKEGGSVPTPSSGYRNSGVLAISATLTDKRAGAP